MRSVNKVILIGNLTRNPELRQTPSGQSVTTFGLATNRQWTTKEGEDKSSAEFHECVAWARLAEICSEYLKKGHLIYVEGYLKTRSWDSPEGIKKFKTEIVVQDMIILEKKANREGAAIDATSTEAPAEETKTEDAATEETTTEDTSTETPAETTTEETPAEETKTEETTTEDTSTEASPSEENPIDRDLGL